MKDQKTGEEERGAVAPRSHDADLRGHRGGVSRPLASEFMITFFQPPDFTDTFFGEQIKLVDIELTKLKELLEKAS